MNDKMDDAHTLRKTGMFRQQAEAVIRLVRDTTAENASRGLMNEQSLENLIELGEGFTTEFKRSGTSGLGREICAFANATGGTLLIGVSDVGEQWVATAFGRPVQQLESHPAAQIREAGPVYSVGWENSGLAALSNQLGDLTAQVILFCIKARSAREIMSLLGLKHPKTFRSNYLKPLLESGWFEMTLPGKPINPNQKYRTAPKARRCWLGWNGAVKFQENQIC